MTDAAGAATYALVDGGVFAANPAMCAWTDLVRDGRAPTSACGLAGHRHGHPADPVSRTRAAGASWSGRGRSSTCCSPALPRRWTSSSGSCLVTATCACRSGWSAASDDLDDASPENLRALRAEGDRLVRENAEAIDALCARLSE